MKDVLFDELQKACDEAYRAIGNSDAAINAVLELLRIHPMHRIGEAAFMRRLIDLKIKRGQ